MQPAIEMTRRLADDLVMAYYGEDAAAAAAVRALAMTNIDNAEAARSWVAVSNILAQARERGPKAPA